MAMHRPGEWDDPKAAPARPVLLHGAVRGRARFRVAELRHDPHLGGDVAQRLIHRPAIRTARVNAVIGTLLVQFDARPVGVLAASAAVSVSTGGLADAALIAGVRVLNLDSGYFSILHADGPIHTPGTTSAPPATVFRDCSRLDVPAESPVAG